MNNPPDISQDPSEHEEYAHNVQKHVRGYLMVGAIFMHLAAEKRLIYRVLIFTGFFVLGLFWLIFLAWYNPVVR